MHYWIGGARFVYLLGFVFLLVRATQRLTVKKDFELRNDGIVMKPDAIGFSHIFREHSTLIVPDLSKKSEFRTSQLVFANNHVWPSRKVLYQTTWEDGPLVTIVLPLDANEQAEILRVVVEERKRYCELHNYGLFVRYIQDFSADGKPAKESLGLASLRMLRQAMLAFPNSQWFWLYENEGHIKNMDSEILVLDKSRLYYAMQVGSNTERVQVTHFATDPEKVCIVATFNESTGILSTKSLIVKRSIISQALLELVTDPILQNWEPFYSSEDHAGTALTHIARWHPLIVSRMALVSPRWSGIQSCGESLMGDSLCLYRNDEWEELI